MRDKKHVFKRGLSLFLALTMCLSLLQVTAFAAADNWGHLKEECGNCHSKDLESTGNGQDAVLTCKDCGAKLYKNNLDAGWTGGQPVGCQHTQTHAVHEDGNADKHQVVCSSCGELVSSEPHNYNEWQITQEPTYDAAGSRTRTCSECGFVQTEEVSKLECVEHTWVCTDNGNNVTHTVKCSECGQVATTDEPHRWFMTGKCASCGAECKHPTENFSYSPNPDGTTHRVTCGICSFEVDKDFSHVYDQDGKCVCGVAKMEVICNHEGSMTYAVDKDTTKHTGTCSKCGATVTQEHTYKLNEFESETEGPACSAKKYVYECELCNHRKTDIKGISHTPDPTEWVTVDVDHHSRPCLYCGKPVGYQKWHTWKSTETTLPTCTQDGVTAYKCSDCQATKEVTTPALGHKYGEYTEKGTGHAKQCSVCGDYTPMEPHEYVDGVCDECGAKKPVQPVEPCEHKWMWKDNKDGTHTFHCGLCGVDDADFVNEPHKFIGGECDKCGAKEPEQGHTHEFTVHVATASVPATCETVGKDVYKCKVAGCTERWTFDLAPLGHDFSGEPVITESTEGCMKGGVKTWTCQRQGCDATKEEPVDAQVSHTYGDKIAEKPAACEVPGMKEHYECEVCGKLFVGTHEVSAEDLEIPALEHSFTHYVPDNNGSCTTAGTETAVCDNGCGETDTRTVAGTGEGHTVVVDAAVAPTCTETGLTEGSHCSACDEVLAEQEVVAAAGHQYDDGVTVTVPDCNHAGATRFTCEVCGDSYEEADSPFGHEVVSYASVAATCTANGYTGGSYCSRCGSVITARTVVPAVGHSWNAGVVTTQPTYYNTGVRTYTCARDASHTYTETIPALTYPGGGGGGSYNPVTPVTPVTPNVPVTPNNPVNIPDANVPQGSTPDGLTTIEDENTPLGGITFVDVTPTDWFYDAVQYVFEKGLMLGVSDTEFGPNLSTTRGMIVTILYRMEGEPEAAAAPFTDVEPGLWYSDAIGWGAANDIVNGYGDGRFGPNDQITREQMAAIFYRYAQYKGYDVTARADLSGYADADQISEYAVEAMQWAVGVKLVNGLTADTLVPKGQATRAQVATMLMRFDQEIAAA